MNKRSCASCIHWSANDPSRYLGECGGIGRNKEDVIYDHQPAAIVTDRSERAILFTRSGFVCGLHQFVWESFGGKAGDEADPGVVVDRHVESEAKGGATFALQVGRCEKPAPLFHPDMEQ